MAARIEVNAGTVRAYLDRAMTRENYHLMYGLHLLSKDRFRGIMDALINGDLQPEDLVRLGSFSDDEADVLLSESLSGWTSGSVATPTAGTDGYQYLTRTLGVDAADPDTLAVGIAPRRVIAAQVIVGDQGHSSLAEVEAVFRDRVLPVALANLTVTEYFPAPADIPCPNQDAARRARMETWASSLLGPLEGPDDATLLRRLIPVGLEHCALRESPGLAEWLLRMPRPAPGTKLLVHREAAVRSSVGEYTEPQLAEILDRCEAAVPHHYSTTQEMAVLDFEVRLARLAIAHHFPGNAELTARAQVMADVLDGLHAHRDRLRAFIGRVLGGCEQYLIGDYPPA